MPKVRRTLYVFLYLEDDHLARVAALMRGGDEQRSHRARMTALAILTGERHRLDQEDLDLLMAVPTDRWVDHDDLQSDRVSDLAEMGLLLSDSADPRLSRLRERDERLDANEWNLYAALYHFMTQWTGVESADSEADPALVSERSRDTARAFVAEHGLPPDPFPDHPSSRAMPLPAIDRTGELYETLLARRTTRAFDRETPMALAELDTVLRYVFGTHGFARNVADVVCIKRTSPSGGCLHPIDAYLIVTNVEDIEAGVYRYDARWHQLVPMLDLTPEEGQQMATYFMSGQHYFGAAHVSFILTARFYRNHWKYRRHQKAYPGILMDAAHLSQTMYLVSTQLGLGCFVTIAINARDIERRLELDGVSEGVIAMMGCGRRAEDGSPLELHFSPDQIG